MRGDWTLKTYILLVLTPLFEYNQARFSTDTGPASVHHTSRISGRPPTLGLLPSHQLTTPAAGHCHQDLLASATTCHVPAVSPVGMASQNCIVNSSMSRSPTLTLTLWQTQFSPCVLSHGLETVHPKCVSCLPLFYTCSTTLAFSS